MKKTPQWELADQMSAFLESSPIGEDLQCMKNREFLYHFEAERLLIMRDLLMAAGFQAERSFAMLDFGFLHGLSQEFLHRFFPGSSVTVCDRPGSPIFADASYMAAIKKRGYVSLVPCDISAIPPEGPKYDVIILGEIIEHLDPTTVAVALSKLRNRINPGGVLMVTTPNRAGLYNSYLTMRGADVQDAPIPHEIMGYGHIHLWSQAALSKTAAHAGWKFRDVRFYHGREGEMFSAINAKWGSLKAQVLLRAMKFTADRVPGLRGFFVIVFNP